jgi:hypothetical protein
MAEKGLKEILEIAKLLENKERLGIMMVLTGAQVLYEDFSLISHPTYGTIQLDPQGRDIYDRMLEEGSIDLRKLEGHYAKVEDLKKLPYPVKRTSGLV